MAPRTNFYGLGVQIYGLGLKGPGLGLVDWGLGIKSLASTTSHHCFCY